MALTARQAGLIAEIRHYEALVGWDFNAWLDPENVIPRNVAALGVAFKPLFDQCQSQDRWFADVLTEMLDK